MLRFEYRSRIYISREPPLAVLTQLKPIPFLLKEITWIISYYLKCISPAQLVVLFLPIQCLYLPKIPHCSFKVYPMHIFKAFGATLLVSVSSLSVSSICLFYISISLVFHKYFLLYQFSLQFLLVFYQVDSAQAIIHLQLSALASTMK